MRFMQPLFLLLYVGMTLAACKPQPTVHADPVEPALVNRTSPYGAGIIFDREAWSFSAGAPIRSSPAIDNGKLFVGTAAGDLLALGTDSGNLIWRFSAGSAIHSSPAVNGDLVFFASNEQKLYAVNKQSGKLVWTFPFPQKMAYPWRFDYFYSSPYLFGDRIFIGADNGRIYAINQADGKELWSFDCGALVRSTPVLAGGQLLAGDCNGRFHALDAATGKELWQFSTLGDSLANENFGFDRKAILAAAVAADGKIIFGCRDGFLYCVDTSGVLQWKVNHNVSWIVGSVAVHDSLVVTGTSDGHFLQAVNARTGREIWKYLPNTLFWSSPLIAGGLVYAGGFDGQMYAIDLYTGTRVSQFQTAGIILSSAVADSHHLYFGSDDGRLYALQSRSRNSIDGARSHRYVYYEPDVKVYFHSGADRVVRDYLAALGYTPVDAATLPAAMQAHPDSSSIIFASDYFPESVLKGGRSSILRRYLDAGGRVILTGTNPLVYRMDPQRKQAVGFADSTVDGILDLDYASHDTRSFGGQFPVFATAKGLELGLPRFWVSAVFRAAGKGEWILGRNENGEVSSFVRFYDHGGALVQLYLDPVRPAGLHMLPAIAERRLPQEGD